MTLWDIGPDLCAQGTVDTLGELVIDGLSCHIDGAWNCRNPQVLWTWNASRGENRTKPRARGRRANQRRVDQGVFSLEFDFDGRWDVEAAAMPATPWIGLQHNLEHFMASIVDPPTPPTKTRDAVLNMPDGSQYVGPIQCESLIHNGTGTSVFTGVLTVIIPGGSLVPLGS